MDLVTSLTGMFLEHTIYAIGRQLGYMIFYRRNVEELKKKLEGLQDEQIVVQHLIDEATRNAENIEDIVQHWMDRVDELTRRAQQFYEEESPGKVGCSEALCPNLCSRYQISRKAKKMALEVAEVLEKGNFNTVSYRVSPQWIEGSTSNKSNEGLNSRTSIMNEVIESLKDPTINMVGLCGLGGVGKTTIAKEVAKKVKDERIFDKVIMAIVSDNPNIEEIQQQIAEMLGMKLDEKTESIRSSHLKKRLQQEKNLLLILDDLWKKLELDKIGFSFDADGKNYKDGNDRRKILLTSRNEKLLYDQMECKRNIKVDVLYEKEALELFKGVAGLHDDHDFLSVAYEIVNLCAGLPIRIVAAAGALRNKNIHEWKDVLDRLKNPLRRNITGIKEADSILSLSYDNINQEIRPIFLLCAMLSHDPLVINLLMYSKGLGLLSGIQNMEQAQYGLESFVSKLKASSLLLESDSNDHFAMHDVVRDVALKIASDKEHTLVLRHVKQYEWPENNLPEGCTQIFVDKCEFIDLPEELYAPRVEFFLLYSKNLDFHIPDTFFKSMLELKVMGLTDMHFLALPSSLSLLEKLRTLCLHSCVLGDIVEVGKLKSLKVLSLANSIIERLPSELGELTHLQMLNLANCSKLEVIPPNVLSCLKRLEILCMANSFNQWEDEGSSKGNKNASLSELKHLPNLSSLDIHIPSASILPKDLFLQNCLERYKIFIGEVWEWSGKYETSKTLKLKLKSSIRWEHGVQKLLEQVEDLYLGDVGGITNVLNDLDGKGFTHLKHLRIQNNDRIEYVVNNSTQLVDAFPKLETLNLQNLKGLKKLCEGRTIVAFQNLRVFKVINCGQVNYVFSISIVKCLCQLIEIEIMECFSIQAIVVTNSQDTFEQNSISNDIIFHRLRSLTMSGLRTLTNFFSEEDGADKDSNTISEPLFNGKVRNVEAMLLRKISSLWDDRLPQSFFSNLKTLIVEKCGFLGKLIPFHVLTSLSNLEELEVSHCELLENVFDFEELNNYEKIESSVVVPLKKLKLSELPKLKNVWSSDLQEIVSFQNLRHVKVYSCGMLSSIFPTSIAKSLLHLEQLDIEFCQSIVAIVASDQVSESGTLIFEFPSLIVLNLSWLLSLRNFYPYGFMSKWPRLQQLLIISCDELETFRSQVSCSSAIETEEALDSKYHIFCHEKVTFPSLEVLHLHGKHALMAWNGQFHFDTVKMLTLHMIDGKGATCAYELLKGFPNLKELEVRGCVEIFSCKEPLGDDASHVAASFQKLILSHLNQAKHIWNEHSPRDILRRLEYLFVGWCDKLISLGPSFISLANLTHLHVSCCDQLSNLLTSSTARSLVHLTKFSIRDCPIIKEIITKQQGEEDDEENIAFTKLEYLELEGLYYLESFCSHHYAFHFPSLQQVIVRECYRFKMFSPGAVDTPLLKGVQVAEDKLLWDTNLNNTIQLLYTPPQSYEWDDDETEDDESI